MRLILLQLIHLLLLQLILLQLIHHQLVNGPSGALGPSAVLNVAMELNHGHEHVLLKVNVRDHRLSQLLAMKVIALVWSKVNTVSSHPMVYG